MLDEELNFLCIQCLCLFMETALCTSGIYVGGWGGWGGGQIFAQGFLNKAQGLSLRKYFIKSISYTHTYTVIKQIMFLINDLVTCNLNLITTLHIQHGTEIL